MTLTITDQTELYALYRALMEAKFHESPNAPEVQGSPYVASVVHRVVDALIEAEEAASNARAVAKWRDWRRGEQHDWLRRFVLARLAEHPQLTPEQRDKHVRALTAPLIVDDAWVAEVIAAASSSS
ncbi:MAG TPA: hypothetical protein VFS20_04950 [Longimicrobium sp.]|nr:hypothetical protein [Longimicrobium sp.]